MSDDTKLVLTQYEKEALITALKKHITMLDSQAKDIAKLKHSSSSAKKDMKRSISKNISLLEDILKKLG